ncbi:MAG: hypothetical protein V2B20_25335 [Pseudomonadota bacterium]
MVEEQGQHPQKYRQVNGMSNGAGLASLQVVQFGRLTQLCDIE